MENIANFREYGIYETTDGRKIKRGKLFRSGNLGHATTKDMETLRDLGIGTVMDFREVGEIESRPDQRIEGIDYVHVPASSFDMKEVKHEKEQNKHFDRQRMIEIYRELPFENKAYARFFELLQTTDRGVLHHCSAGKDRAGIAAALTLLLLGVSKEDVMEDYLKTNENMHDLVANLTGITDEDGYQEVMKYAKDAFIVSEDYLNATFEAILSKYPDFDTFFEKEYGLTEEIRNEFKEKYLEK